MSAPCELLLMTPGPSRVPERIRQAGAAPMIHHRSEEFSALLSATLHGLRSMFGTRAPILPLHTTGRGGMEAAVANLFAPGDEIVACCNGKFGVMWAAIAERYGLTVHRIATEWGAALDPERLRLALAEHRAARAVTLVHSDTSTGVMNDVPAAARAAHDADALLLVDGISSIGGVRFGFDDWDVDVAVTASQKCLMCSPGLAFVALSERAWAATQRADLPRAYLDLPAVRETLSKPRPQTPGTTPVHLVMQVREAVAMIEDEGLENVFARHLENAHLALEGATRLGLSLLHDELPARSPTLTGLMAPDGVTPAQIRSGLEARGILVAGGLGDSVATAFRIGHLGDIRPPDVERTMAALEEVLAERAV